MERDARGGKRKTAAGEILASQEHIILSLQSISMDFLDNMKL